MLVVARGLWRPGDYGGQGTVAAGGILVFLELWRPGGLWQIGVCGGRGDFGGQGSVAAVGLWRPRLR